MIPSGVQIFVALEPVDMRWSFDRLAAVALDRIGYDVKGGALFIYFGKRRQGVKILFCDASGMCIFYKRLHRGVFRLPPALVAGAAHVEIDDATLDALLDGVEVSAAPKRVRAARLH
ncbi:MAG TPA: IS66 family insertion sequence element accessory protein TnpB [Polyangiaceae bacterium]|nr:IS66 family insertion sequence element accessory protein TnpB [Polyangiaceae bacterium]